MRGAALLLGVLLLAACGSDTASSPAWVAAHPDTALSSFQVRAPGVCAITVRYPEAAPAAIVYLGGEYVQVDRQAHSAGPPGREVDHSGDWHIFAQSGGDLLLQTPGDTFTYRAELSC